MNKEVGIVIGMILLLIVCIVFLGFLYLITSNVVFLILASVPLLILLVLFFGGLTIVPPEKRYVVEILGKFYDVLQPGLQWVCPFFMKIRAECETWEQSIGLFTEPIKIDFVDGSARLKGVYAFVRLCSPDVPYEVPGFPTITGGPETGSFRAIYEVDDWGARIKELLENASRSYLGSLGLDDALKEGKGGYNLFEGDRIPADEGNRIKDKIKAWGWELTKLTVTDFDLDESIIAARDRLQKARREADAAELEILTRSRETIGSLVQMFSDATGKPVDEIKEEINGNPEFRDKILLLAQDLVIRQMSIDGGALVDVRGSGNPLLELIEVWKREKTGSGAPPTA